MIKYLEETRLLDRSHPRISGLIEARGWRELDLHRAVGSAYDFVRDEIRFGYNASDELPASAVLADGYGQCNTKGTLLMALLRGIGVPCRFHAFTIDKALQRGAIHGLAYALSPREIIHSWVEVAYEGRWVSLEGFILDRDYLSGVRRLFPEAEGAFCGYAIGTEDLLNPPIEWNGTDTYIQHTAIRKDYGVFDCPDDFYAEHGSNLHGLRRFLYAHLLRHRINARVERIRGVSSGGNPPVWASSRHAATYVSDSLDTHAPRIRVQ